MLELGNRHFPLVYLALSAYFKAPPCVTEFLMSLASPDLSKKTRKELEASAFLMSITDYVLNTLSSYTGVAKEERYAKFLDTFRPTSDPDTLSNCGLVWEEILRQKDQIFLRMTEGEGNQVRHSFNADDDL